MDLHQADSVVKYARLYADANDTANIRNSAKEVGRAQSLYDYSSHQQEALKKSKEVQNLWRILFFCFVASVLVLGTIYTFYIKYRKKVLAEKRELNSKYALALHDYNEALEEYKKYKENGVSYEASLLEKIGELEKDLSMYRDNLDVDRLAWEQNLQKHQIVTIMHSHASKLTQLTTVEWSALIDVVGNHIPDFLASLEATSVRFTDDELRVCVLTRIGFVPSEIAVLMDMTKQNVTNLRSSLNKKIFNEAGARTFTHNISKL